MNDLQKFVVTAHAGATLNLSALVKLTAEQAASRAHAIEETAAPGLYRVLATVGFKRGEVISVDPATISKAQFAEVAPSDSDAAAEAVADVQAAKAKGDKITGQRKSRAKSEEKTRAKAKSAAKKKKPAARKKPAAGAKAG